MRRFLRRHWLVITSVVLVIALAGGLVWRIEVVGQNQLAAIHAASRRQLASLHTTPAKSVKVTPPTPVPPVATPVAAPASKSSCNTATAHIDPTSIDVLVNKKHCLIPINYAPSDLTTVDGATLSAKAAPSFDAMFHAAAAAGYGFSVTSSYRSYTTQVATYNHWVSVSGVAGADEYSARPGYSEHQTGFAVDVQANGKALSDFNGTPQAQWLAQHAADYGFIQRYPDGYQAITGYETEDWHYRYVGTTAAKDMQAKGIKTLEQYWGLPGGDYN